MRGKFQSKLIASQIIMVICLILFIVGIFYGYVVKELTAKTLDDFHTISSKTVTQFDTLLHNMDKTALQIAANPNIVSTFQKLKKEEGNYFIQEPINKAEIVKLLNSYNFKKVAFARICLYNNYDDYVGTATTVMTTSGMQKFFDSQYFAEIKEHFKQNNNFMYYLAPKEDLLNDTGLSNRRYISIIREIKDYTSNSSKCGYVEVQEYFDRIEHIFGDLGEQSYALVLDEKKEIIYDSTELEKDNAYRRAIRDIIEEIKNRDTEEKTNYHKGYYYTYRSVGESPFQVLFLKRQESMVKPLTRFSLLIILVMVISLILALGVEIILIKRLSKPLEDLWQSIQKVNINNYTIKIEESKNSDELKQLQDAFNSIFCELKDTMDKHYIAKTNELKSHLFALQSQMNPHFMHNILAIISMEAEEVRNEKTQRICQKLCRMLSFTSSMQDGFCKMSDEVNNACDYLDLMKERYEELFEYTVQVEEGLEQVRIPKLIVQPICENCFNHGFKKKNPLWEIGIRVYSIEDKWFIEIRDNGTGFSKEYLEEYKKLQQEVTLENVKEKLESMQIGGLCIPNIYMRLKICYGDSFLCRMENDVMGTRVLFGGALMGDGWKID